MRNIVAVLGAIPIDITDHGGEADVDDDGCHREAVEGALELVFNRAGLVPHGFSRCVLVIRPSRWVIVWRSVVTNNSSSPTFILHMKFSWVRSLLRPSRCSTRVARWAILSLAAMTRSR